MTFKTFAVILFLRGNRFGVLEVLRDIEDIIQDYVIIGGTMGIITVLVKPFVSWKKTIRDIILSFVFSMLCGLLLEYWQIPYAVKVGISGTCGLFAVRIYEIINIFFTKVEQHPEQILRRFRKYDDDDRSF